jgi:hypothetical protein
MRLDPNAPAYPQGPKDRYGEPIRGEGMGFTVRQEFAKHMMGNVLVGVDKPNMQVCASLAVEAADALIAELNKEQA